MIRALVGLGNPGKKYVNTRHNLGFRVINTLFSSSDFHAIPMLTPLDGMNLSGEIMPFTCKKLDIKPNELLVFLDCMALPLGELRFRRKGSSAGHKGLQSIMDYLDTDEIPRIRLGIGSKPPEMDTVDFVLGEFTKEENDVVEEMIEKIYSFLIQFTELKKLSVGRWGLEIVEEKVLTDGAISQLLNFEDEDSK